MQGIGRGKARHKAALVAQGPPRCPLTGTLAPNEKVAQRAAVAVKVENLPQARPQWGLDKADIVFEEPVEGGITRFIAVFQCQSAARIEPVRSGRLVDPQILEPLGRILFGYSGAIQPAINEIDSKRSLLVRRRGGQGRQCLLARPGPLRPPQPRDLHRGAVRGRLRAVATGRKEARRPSSATGRRRTGRHSGGRHQHLRPAGRHDLDLAPRHGRLLPVLFGHRRRPCRATAPR